MRLFEIQKNWVPCGIRNKTSLCLLAIFTFLPASIQQSVSDTKPPNYYWRDHTGIIPHDALPGGLDKDGNTIYIGQVLHEGLLVPGQVFATNETKIYFDYRHRENVSDENIKILCTSDPEQFQWIKTNNSNIKALAKERYLISGGFERGYMTYIGKKHRDGEILVGKVLSIVAAEGNPVVQGLHTTRNGKVAKYDSFEVLSDRPDIPTQNTINSTDIHIQTGECITININMECEDIPNTNPRDKSQCEVFNININE